jgi:HEAT repeat protein
LLDVLEDVLGTDPGRAVDALDEISSDPARPLAAVPTILSVLRDSPSPRTLAGARAVRILLNGRPDVALHCWPDPAPLGRRAVVSSIPAVGGMGTSVVKEGAQDLDAGVRARACRRLATLERHQAVALALAALEDGESEVRRAAAEVLGILAGKAELPDLLKLFAAVDSARAPEVLRVLAQVGARHPGELVLTATGTGETDVRVAAIQALGATGLMSVAADVAELLVDRVKDVRRAAAAALADIARLARNQALPPGTIERIVRQLERERSSSVTMALIDVIEVSRAAVATEALLRKLPDMHAAIRQRALEVMDTVLHPQRG